MGNGSRYTYKLYLRIYQYGKGNFIPEIIFLEFTEEGESKDKPETDLDKFKWAFERGYQSKTLREWGVEKEEQLIDKCAELNQGELDRAREDLREWEGKLKELPESPDIKNLVSHLQKVVGRYELWFRERDRKPADNIPTSDEYEFILRDEAWQIRFQGGERRYVADLKGMCYISRLLKNQESDVHTNEFYHITPVAKYIDDVVDTERNESGKIESSELRVRREEEPVELMDQKTKNDCEKRIKKLKEEIDDLKECGTISDDGEIVKREKVIDDICQYLKEAVPQKKPDPKALKRKKDSLRNAINDSIENIRKYLPDLADHLHDSIDVRDFCQYRSQNGPIPWILDI